MTVLLETRVLPPAEREAALNAALNSATSPTRVSLTPDTQSKISAWRVDDDISLIDSHFATRDLRVSHSERHLAGSASERLSVAYNQAGACLTTNHGRQVIRNDHLRLTDTTSPYDIVWRGNCHAIACEIDYARLGLSVDAVRAVSPLISHSPIHHLLRIHLLQLPDVAEKSSSNTLAMVGAATVDLVRAAFLSVSPVDGHRRQAMAETLPIRIEAYIRNNLSEPDLNPSRVAAAHSISLRHLYALLADRHDSPAEWIMQLRLEAARDELSHHPATVSATAIRWGFKNASHFSRRFRTAYGMSPREWMNQTH